MKFVFFTGATGGLGEPCVRALSASGRWTVFAAGMNAVTLERLGKEPNVIPVRLDVTDDESVAQAREIVLKHTPRLDAIVNFAGFSGFGSLVEGSAVEDLRHVLDVNVLGTARVNRAFFNLLDDGGRIINCSSEAGWMKPQPFAGAYSASKRAVEAYNDSLRRELMYLGIRVIKLQPGSFRTHITQSLLDSFDRTLAETRLYAGLLKRMKPLMQMEMNHNGNFTAFVRTVMKALEARRPRLRYRVGTGKLLMLMQIVPDPLLDAVYRRFYGRRETL